MEITRKDLDENNFFKDDRIETDEKIIFKEGLGVVRVRKSIITTKYILAGVGTGIEAGESIKAGWGIKASESVEAGEGIEAGESIKAGTGIEAGWRIKAGERIEASMGIITFFNNITAKYISCSRIVAGFNAKEKQTITATIRRGDVILGKVVKPKE